MKADAAHEKLDIVAIIEKMAALAKISFEPAEFDRFAEKAKAVLAYVEKLNELETEGIEPTSHAVEMEAPLREDLAIACQMEKDILEQAPIRDGVYIQVPKVLEGE